MPYLYYVFGKTLEEVLDTDNFKMPPYIKELPGSRYSWRKKEEVNLSKVVFKVPKNIEFIGSLAEYVKSLPNVDEDWYNEALLRFPLPKLINKD